MSYSERRSAPDITWVFAVNSGVGLNDREEHVSAPVDADRYALERELFDAGYIRVSLLRKEWEKWAWPGGYPIYYVAADGELLCSHCCNDNIDQTGAAEAAEADWTIVAADINYEEPDLQCAHCDKTIESAYCEPVDKDMESSHSSDMSADAEALASAGHGTDEDYGSAEDML